MRLPIARRAPISLRAKRERMTGPCERRTGAPSVWSPSTWGSTCKNGCVGTRVNDGRAVHGHICPIERQPLRSRTTIRLRWGRVKDRNNQLLNATTLKGFLSPLTTVTSSAGAMAILVVATRAGDFTGVAAFAMGSSLMVVLALLGSGGTGILYATGDAITQAAVWKLRSRLVTPSLTIISILIGVIAAHALSLPWLATTSGTISVVFLNFQEMDTLALQRGGRLGTLFSITLASRLAGIIGGALFSSYAAGMLLATGISALLFRILGGAPKAVSTIPLAEAIRTGYKPGPMAMQILDHAGVRWPLIAVPMLFTGVRAGHLSSVLQLWLAAAGVVVALPYTAMARRGSGHSSRDLELASAALAVVAVITMWAGAPLVPRLINLPDQQSVAWTRVLALAILARTLAKLVQYRLASFKRYTSAAIACLPLALAWVPLVCGLKDPSELLVCTFVLAGEMLGLGLGASLIWKRVWPRLVDDPLRWPSSRARNRFE